MLPGFKQKDNNHRHDLENVKKSDDFAIQLVRLEVFPFRAIHEDKICQVLCVWLEQFT